MNIDDVIKDSFLEITVLGFFFTTKMIFVICLMMTRRSHTSQSPPIQTSGKNVQKHEFYPPVATKSQTSDVVYRSNKVNSYRITLNLNYNDNIFAKK